MLARRFDERIAIGYRGHHVVAITIECASIRECT